MKTTATALRRDLYNLLDHALDTGEVIEVMRHGRVVRLVPDAPTTLLDKLVRRDVIVGDPAELIHMDWSQEWRP